MAKTSLSKPLGVLANGVDGPRPKNNIDTINIHAMYFFFIITFLSFSHPW